jgi:hypothetical protein
MNSILSDGCTLVIAGGHRRIKDPLPAVYRRNNEMIERIVSQYDQYSAEGRLREYLRAIAYRLKVNTAVRMEEDNDADD